jgi:hypothetical protein
MKISSMDVTSELSSFIKFYGKGNWRDAFYIALKRMFAAEGQIVSMQVRLNEAVRLLRGLVVDANEDDWEKAYKYLEEYDRIKL